MHLIETDVLPLNQFRLGTRQDSVLNRIMDRIKRNTWSNCSMAERLYKESRHKLIEKGIICNGDIIVPPVSE